MQIVEDSTEEPASNPAQVPRKDGSPNYTLAAALAYALEGLKVLPIHAPDPDQPGGCNCGKPDCSSPGKHPIGSLVRRGHKDATTDPELIRRWFTAYPNANVAAVPGEAEFVVDVDPRNGGEESFLQMQSDFGAFATRHFRTGSGGDHYWFTTEETVRGRTGILPGIDIKTSSGYLVMPTIDARRWFVRSPRPLPSPAGSPGTGRLRQSAKDDSDKAAN